MMINRWSRVQGRGRRGALAGAAVGAVLVLLWFAPVPEPVASGVLSLSEPVIVAVDRWSVGGILGALVADRRELIREREALRRELAARSGEVVSPATPDHRGLTARVIRRPGQSLTDRLLIDQGRDDGVAVGDVVSAAGFALGEVVATYAGSARVELYSNHGRSFVALLAHAQVGTSSATATPSYTAIRSAGLGGGGIRAFAPRSTPVAEGDLLYLSLDALRPVARVERVERDPIDPTLTLLALQPPVGRDLLFVQVTSPPEVLRDADL